MSGQMDPCTADEADWPVHSAASERTLEPVNAVLTGTVSLVVAGGSPLLRTGMVTALADDPRFRLVATCQDVHDGLLRAEQSPVDVLVLLTDEPLPVVLDLQDQLRSRRDQVRVLLLRQRANWSDMREALQAGLGGYGIAMPLTAECFTGGILSMAQQGTWLCPLTARALKRTRSVRAARHG
jgi:DNA-binding NarL/FixJ family response regulator